MKGIVLLENTCLSGQFACTHGLSLWLETGNQAVLFDMGPNAMFAQNAQAMGLSLSDINLAVISHGHYDHGGGLDIFLRRNQTAPVYVRPSAFFRHTKADGSVIGLKAPLSRRPQLRFTQSIHPLSPDLLLFSTAHACPTSMGFLEDGKPDAFLHEQSLLISEAGAFYLIAGCAHGGMPALIHRAKELCGRYPDIVVGGFHLAHASQEEIHAVGKALAALPVVFYTGHCTGEPALSQLEQLLPGQIHRISTGTRFPA